jgi:hypothetical protein
MSLYGAVRLLIVGWDRASSTPQEVPLAEIPPGAAAAWADGEHRRALTGLAPGDACVTPDGRPGRVVELVEGPLVTLICGTA